MGEEVPQTPRQPPNPGLCNQHEAAGAETGLQPPLTQFLTSNGLQKGPSGNRCPLEEGPCNAAAEQTEVSLQASPRKGDLGGTGWGHHGKGKEGSRPARGRGEPRGYHLANSQTRDSGPLSTSEGAGQPACSDRRLPSVPREGAGGALAGSQTAAPTMTGKQSPEHCHTSGSGELGPPSEP